MSETLGCSNSRLSATFANVTKAPTEANGFVSGAAIEATRTNAVFLSISSTHRSTCKHGRRIRCKSVHTSARHSSKAYTSA